MRPLYRWIIAIVLAAALIAIFYPIGWLGFALGGMGTDSCDHLSMFATYYLEILWPLALLATAVTPSILIIRQVRWRWPVISLFIGLLVSLGCWILYFPLLSTFWCK
jgi:hypothetical protein